MENKVGDEVPTEAEIVAAVKVIAELRAKLAKFTVKLTPEERRHLLRFRPGGERIVELIGGLAEKYDVTLPDMPVEGMRDDLTLAQRLAPLVREVNLLGEHLADTTAAAYSEAWQAATGNYSVLSRVSAANPALASELGPAKEFFATRKRKTTPPAEG